MNLDIVIPCFNSEKFLATLIESVKEAFQGGADIRLILVDDGSVDNTWGVITKYAKELSWIEPIKLTKNNGEQAAVRVGLSVSSADLVAVIDDDLQFKPIDILRLVAEMDGETDIVFGVARERADSLWRIWSSCLNQLVLNGIFQSSGAFSSFKLMRRDLVLKLLDTKDLSSYIEAEILAINAPTKRVKLNKLSSLAIASRYNFRSLWRLHLSAWKIRLGKNISFLSNNELKSVEFLQCLNGKEISHCLTVAIKSHQN